MTVQRPHDIDDLDDRGHPQLREEDGFYASDEVVLPVLGRVGEGIDDERDDGRVGPSKDRHLDVLGSLHGSLGGVRLQAGNFTDDEGGEDVERLDGVGRRLRRRPHPGEGNADASTHDDGQGDDRGDYPYRYFVAEGLVQILPPDRAGLGGFLHAQNVFPPKQMLLRQRVRIVPPQVQLPQAQRLQCRPLGVLGLEGHIHVRHVVFLLRHLLDLGVEILDLLAKFRVVTHAQHFLPPRLGRHTL
mmetsp:Transcript_52062/g.156219  ORF Transcript_52062/g.156219 Transcript_52062/m.156219 type:complete len:244 (-) Transcript_52062:1002-1733(-)